MRRREVHVRWTQLSFPHIVTLVAFVNPFALSSSTPSPHCCGSKVGMAHRARAWPDTEYSAKKSFSLFSWASPTSQDPEPLLPPSPAILTRGTLPSLPTPSSVKTKCCDDSFSDGLGTGAGGGDAAKTAGLSCLDEGAFDMGGTCFSGLVSWGGGSIVRSCGVACPAGSTPCHAPSTTPGSGGGG